MKTQLYLVAHLLVSHCLSKQRFSESQSLHFSVPMSKASQMRESTSEQTKSCQPTQPCYSTTLPSYRALLLHPARLQSLVPLPCQITEPCFTALPGYTALLHCHVPCPTTQSCSTTVPGYTVVLHHNTGWWTKAL